MASNPWNDGHILTLSPGDTASCVGGPNRQQFYALFFYNSAQNDTGATLNVVWSNSEQPVTVTVPGTTGRLGLASLLFVSGNDTNSVSVSMSQNQPGAQVQSFIGSVKMPTLVEQAALVVEPMVPLLGRNAVQHRQGLAEALARVSPVLTAGLSPLEQDVAQLAAGLGALRGARQRGVQTLGGLLERGLQVRAKAAPVLRPATVEARLQHERLVVVG